nr:RNA-directed DNA polymerase, eukaryota [Tanacetum cinerariifolium]
METDEGVELVVDQEKDAEVEGRHRDKQAEIYNIDLDHSSKVVTAAATRVAAASAPIHAAKLAVKPKVLKIAAAPAISTRKRKGVVIRDPEEEIHTDTPAETPSVKDKGKGILSEDPKPLKKKDQIEMDAEYAKKLQEELDKEHEEAYKHIDWNAAFDHVQAKKTQYIKRYHGFKKKPQSESEARKNMISYLKNTEGYKMEFFKGKTYDQILLIFQARGRVEIVQDEEDDVFVEAIPRAQKVSVVDYQVVVIDNKPRRKVENHPSCLSLDQFDDLKRNVSYGDVKRPVLDCGANKSSRHDGLPSNSSEDIGPLLIKMLLLLFLNFFSSSKFPSDYNALFITLIPKTQDAKLVKDFRPISLIGSIYKIITKIMKAFDSVRWDYLDDILDKFSFGLKLRGWIQGCLNSAKGSILVNGSPTSEFIFHKGLKQGDPLSPFLFILVMKSLHISFKNVLDACLFKGLKINLHKSKLMGISISQNDVTRDFFNGVENKERKLSMIAWKKVLAAKNKGGLGISSLFAIFGIQGALDNPYFLPRRSNWLDIIWEFDSMSSKGINLLSHAKIKVGNEDDKLVSVFDKLNDPSLIESFRRTPRGGIEDSQLHSFAENVVGVILSSQNDRWVWSLKSSGHFSVKSAPVCIDDFFLPYVGVSTIWVNAVPIKINIFAWRMSLDKLPTRLNLSLRGIDIPYIICPICSNARESSFHIFIKCHVARELLCKVARWWELEIIDVQTYEDCLSWFLNLRLPKRLKDILEGVFYTLWWSIWRFRNQAMFRISRPLLDFLFDEIVQLSYNWCSSR